MCLANLCLFVHTLPRLSWVFVELSPAARHQSCFVLLHNMPAPPSSTSTSPKQSSSHSSTDTHDQQNSKLKRRFVELEQASPMANNSAASLKFMSFPLRTLEKTIAQPSVAYVREKTKSTLLLRSHSLVALNHAPLLQFSSRRNATHGTNK